MWSGYLSYKIENLEDLTDQHLTKQGTQPETGRQKQIWRPKENTFPTVQIMHYTEQNNTELHAFTKHKSESNNHTELVVVLI